MQPPINFGCIQSLGNRRDNLEFFDFFFFHGKTAVLLPRVKSLRSLETLSLRSENPENMRSGSVR